MSTVPRPSSATLFNLQYLRAFAALMVVAYHGVESTSRLDGVEAFPSFNAGQGGVDIFFVLSGFIIWHTTRPSDGPLSFAIRRIKRIVPLYWVLTIILTTVALLPFGLTRTTQFDPAHLLASLAFLPWPHPTIGHYIPVIFVGWTLNFEMAFYLLFAIALVFTRAVRATMTVAVLGGLALLGTFVATGTVLDFYLEPIILEFAFGMLIAMVYRSMPRLPAWFWFAALAAGFATMLLLAETGAPRLAWAGVPSALIVLAAVLLERERPRPPLVWLAFLGSASFSIYLSHVLMLPAAQIVWSGLMPAAVGPWFFGYMAAMMAVCAIGGVGTYITLEIPLSHLADRIDRGLRRRPRPVPSLATRYRQSLAP